SDFPVDEPNSMETVYRAMKRCLSQTAFECEFGRQSEYRYCPESEGELQSGDFGALPPEEERLALEEVLQAYTMGGVYANFLENELGSIETGKLADMIVLDRNLFSLDTEEIPQVRVSKTIFEGRIVFETDSALI
ncbi:MAG: amidohydrolase family protein, partial [Deltaproteobacteria bacterium]|nr:amidohydrolase family protein [Deltaproteobacteria bacterium]